MTQPLIRPVRPEDLPELILLCREHAAFEGTECTEDGQLARLAHAFFAVPPALYGWVVVDRCLVGYMTATREFATWPAAFFIHMDCLYLREPYRRKGLGRRQIEVLTAFSQEQDCELIQWQTPPNNILGIAFYEGVGAFSRDKKRFYYPRDRWENERAVP